MNLVTAIIIDDEEHNRNVLNTLLKKYCSLVQIIAESSNADDAFDKINKLHPQLVFLDIKMPNKSGFDLLKMFDSIDFEVIFVSAFNEYAITAFDFNALGYILKPIDYSKLLKVVDRAIYKINSNKQNNDLRHFIKTIEEKNDIINKISIHTNDKVFLIPISDIVSVEASISLCELVLIDSSKYHSSKSLKLFENMLDRLGNFIRISKSLIINVNYIKSYSKGDVCILQMKNGMSHEVSRRKKADVLNKIKP
jgi:two-component system LytT family response regulator